MPEVKVDNSTFKTYALYNGALEQKKPDLNYNFIIEQIKKFVHNAKQNGQFKMYQTRGFCEYKLLSKYCKIT